MGGFFRGYHMYFSYTVPRFRTNTAFCDHWISARTRASVFPSRVSGIVTPPADVPTARPRSAAPDNAVCMSICAGIAVCRSVAIPRITAVTSPARFLADCTASQPFLSIESARPSTSISPIHPISFEGERMPKKLQIPSQNGSMWKAQPTISMQQLRRPSDGISHRWKKRIG